MKLIVIDGKQSKKEYPIQEAKINTVGRSDKEKRWSPDIDLGPDKRVSRDKVSIWLEDGHWSIKDSGSKHGTLVNGKEIKGLEEPTSLLPGTLIKMGDTILMADPTKNRLWGCRQGLVVDFDCLPAIGYLLHHCAIPAISYVRVSNLRDTATSPFTLSFSIPGYSRPFGIEVPELEPGAVFFPDNTPDNTMNLPFYPWRLEGQEGKSRVRIEVKADGDMLLQKDLWVLGLYEYPYEYEPAYRKVLAGFVLPGSPVVQMIVADARRCLEKIAETDSFYDLIRSSPANYVESILHALYDCLSKTYEIRYLPPSSNGGFNTQVICPPHRIIYDPQGKRGEGTCIDLTLLMAACLENIGLQPVIVMTKKSEELQHAFLGCWSGMEDRFAPILSDFDRVNRAVEKGKLLLVECTGFSRMDGVKLPYDQAKKEAEEQMVPQEFLYTLDISSLRIVSQVDRVTPLDHSYSPAVLRIVQEAYSLAWKKRSKEISTAHLLYGFLASSAADSAPVAKKVFARPGFNVDQARDNIANRVSQGFEVDLRPSKNATDILQMAKGSAGQSNYGIVEEHHLLSAFLKCGSKNIDTALADIGTNRQRVKDALVQYLRERELNPDEGIDTVSLYFPKPDDLAR